MEDRPFRVRYPLIAGFAVNASALTRRASQAFKNKKADRKKINLLSCSFIFFSQILNYSPVTTVVLKTKRPRILVIFSSQVATFVILPFLAAFAILASPQKIRPSNVPPEDFPSFSVIVAAPADTGITVEHPVNASAIAKAIIPKNFFIYFSHKRLKKNNL